MKGMHHWVLADEIKKDRFLFSVAGANILSAMLLFLFVHPLYLSLLCLLVPISIVFVLVSDAYDCNGRLNE